MKKATALFAATLALAVASGSLFAAQTRVYRLADNQPDGYPTVLGDLALAKYVQEKTKGAIKIEVYNNSVLGNEKETIEQTQTGDIHFIRVGLNPLSSINPVMNALAMPFLFRDRAHMFKVLDGPIGQELLESLQKQNLLGLCWLDAGFRNFYNSKKEIKTPDDMKGLKIRVQESALMMDMIRYLGASPTPMPYGEVYPGIQNGIIDGAENNWPSYITAAHFEVAKYFTVDGHMASPEMILVNTGVWNSLSEAEKKIVKEGAMEGAKVERAAWLEAEATYEKKARDAGSIITELTPEQHKLFQDALAPLYQQPAYTSFADIIKRVRETK
ncbi:MAG: TRAP transporter substrate-binding protein [Candidatus Accumulibacter sp.]|jgi:tripartite ATP-independent transporter DctP family solute receptor|nr:TRAP transporter substrate-binding protein [Accumulibacter sp.]